MRDDRRGIGGMPIRLVVAVAVGTAALGLLVPMLNTVEESADTEITIGLEPQEFVLDSGKSTAVRIDVVTTDGEPVTDATVLISNRSLSVEDGPLIFETGPDSSSVTVDVGTATDTAVPVEFRPTQSRGTLSISTVVPPSSDYVDEIDNPEITIRQPS
jgi:hypothetical protein